MYIMYTVLYINSISGCPGFEGNDETRKAHGASALARGPAGEEAAQSGLSWRGACIEFLIEGLQWEPQSREPQVYSSNIRGTYLPGS